MADDRPQTTAIAIAIGLIGFLGGTVGYSLTRDLVTSTVGRPGPVYEQWVAVVGFGLGTVATVGLFLAASDRGTEFVDLAWPTRRDLAAILAGLVAIFGLYGAVTLVRHVLAIPSAQSQVGQAIEASSAPIAVVGLVVLSVIVVGPTEELLFRNVVQKRLRAAYSGPAAIVIASLFFAAPHLGQYASGPVAGTIVSLVTVFVLATVLGSVYEATGNLLVPAAVHGLFNAVQIVAAWMFLP